MCGFGRKGGDEDNRPQAKIPFDGMECWSLFDSGAGASCLSWRKFLQLSKRPRLTNTNVELRTASGDQLEVVGEAMLPAYMGGKWRIRPFLIVKNLRAEAIIGNDLLMTEGVVMDYARKKITWGRPDERIAALAVSRETTVLPRQQRLVSMQVDGADLAGEVIAEDGNATECVVTDGVYTMHDAKQVMVVVSNPQNVPITLSRNQIMGTVRTAAGKHERFIDDITPEAVAAWKKKQKPENFPKNLYDNIPNQFRAKYAALLSEFDDVFSKYSYDIGKCTVMPQRISLVDPNKIASEPNRPIPVHLRGVVRDYICKLLAAGVVEPSTSRFSSPVLLCRKPGNYHASAPLTEQFRLVQDLRKQNLNCHKSSYPLRNCQMLIDEIAGAKIWSVVDLSSGYFNQELEESSRDYVAFSLSSAAMNMMLRWTRSPQGFINSTASFQRLLDYVTTGLKGTYCYVDDVILASQTHEEHLAQLRALFERFRKYNLRVSRPKLRLGTAVVEFLGQELRAGEGVRPGALKIAALKDWQPPQTRQLLKSFLGLTSWFRRAVCNYARIAAPLTRLTRKDSTWMGGKLPEEAEKAFFELKRILMSRPVLAPVNPNRTIYLNCDSSQTHLGCTLSQVSEADGIERPCAYASRALTPGEASRSATEREHLACGFALKHFQHLTRGNKLNVLRSDHQPLLALNRISGSQMARMRADLAEYEPFQVVYLEGSKHPGDAPSRFPAQNVPNPAPLLRVVDEAAEVEFEKEEKDLNDHVEVNDVSVSGENLFHLQRDDHYAKAMTCFKKYGQMPHNKLLQDFVETWKDVCTYAGGLVLGGAPELQLPYVPVNFRETVLRLAHDHPSAGHRSFAVTLGKVEKRFWWPALKADVFAHCQNCQPCNKVNRAAHSRPLPLQPLTPAAPNFGDKCIIDLLGPFPSSTKSNSKYLLVAVDYATRYTELIAMPDKKQQTVCDAFFEHFLMKHGMFLAASSDNGSEFVSGAFKGLCARLGIKQYFSSPGHPATQGAAERQNATFLAELKKLINEDSASWEDDVAAIQFSMNTNYQSSLKFSPFVAATGRRPHLPLDLLTDLTRPDYSESDDSAILRRLHRVNAEVRKNQRAAFLSQKEQFDKRAREKVFRPGDRVYVTRPHSGPLFQKLQAPYQGPMTVECEMPHQNYRLLREGKKPMTVHANRIKPLPYQNQLHILHDVVEGGSDEYFVSGNGEDLNKLLRQEEEQQAQRFARYDLNPADDAEEAADEPEVAGEEFYEDDSVNPQPPPSPPMPQPPQPPPPQPEPDDEAQGQGAARPTPDPTPRSRPSPSASKGGSAKKALGRLTRSVARATGFDAGAEAAADPMGVMPRALEHKTRKKKQAKDVAKGGWK